MFIIIIFSEAIRPSAAGSYLFVQRVTSPYLMEIQCKPFAKPLNGLNGGHGASKLTPHAMGEFLKYI